MIDSRAGPFEIPLEDQRRRELVPVRRVVRCICKRSSRPINGFVRSSERDARERKGPKILDVRIVSTDLQRFFISSEYQQRVGKRVGGLTADLRSRLRKVQRMFRVADNSMHNRAASLKSRPLSEMAYPLEHPASPAIRMTAPSPFGKKAFCDPPTRAIFQ